jgi:hypothetical protein
LISVLLLNMTWIHTWGSEARLAEEPHPRATLHRHCLSLRTDRFHSFDDLTVKVKLKHKQHVTVGQYRLKPPR